MHMPQKVSEVMTADFPTVLEDEPLTKVLGFFADKGVDVVVVVSRDSGRVIGVVTKRSVLKPNINPSQVSAKSLAVKTQKISPDDPLEKAAAAMLEKNIKALPVLENGKPIAIVKAVDVVLGARGMLKDVLVNDVMTKQVITVDAEETIGKAVALMRDEGVSRLPVLNRGLLAGIVTVTDIAEKVLKPRMKSSWGDVAGEKVRTLSNPVKSIMTRDVVTASPGEKLVDAVERMKQYGFSCLVVAERKRVVGIITLMDALGPLAKRGVGERAGIAVEVSYKLDRVDVDDKERVLETANRFVQRFRKALGQGVLSLYFKEHKEKHGDLRLIHCRARLNSDRYQFVGVGEAWRPDLAARTALKIIERKLIVQKELAAKYPFGREFLESLEEYY
jgi:CBS domain-containing protein